MVSGTLNNAEVLGGDGQYRGGRGGGTNYWV